MGNLSILSATNIVHTYFAEINLAGGSGTLNIVASGGNIDLDEASFIANQGTGPSTITASGNLSISSAPVGSSSVMTNGDTSIAVTQLNMVGYSSAIPSKITTSQGNLSISANLINLNPYNTISLNGSGNLTINLAEDLSLANGSTIQNLGSGNSTYTIAGAATLFGGLGSGTISSNTGSLTINIGDNLNLVSNLNGSGAITANGPISITAQNVALSGLGSQSLIQTTAGDISIIANNNVAVRDVSAVVNLGAGNITLVADQQDPTPPLVGPGRFILDPNANLATSSGGLLRVFTAKPNGISAGNLAFGQTNGNYVTAGLACAFDPPPASATEQYNTYYSTFTGGYGDPYTIFYKTSGPSIPPAIPNTSVLQQQLSNVSWCSAEIFFILREYVKYYWDIPFLVCYECAPGKTDNKTLFDCDLFEREYPKTFQNWTKYPVYFPQAYDCADL